MFTVIITEKGGDQRRMDFDKPEVTIGRVQGNDIILPKGNVSKRHSRIVLKDGKFIIVDLKSTNGTYVNGRKITSPLVLKDTDKVYIGDFILNVEDGVGDELVTGAQGNPSVQHVDSAPTGSSSLVSNPPPVPKRPPVPPAPPSLPPARAAAPAPRPLDVDDDDDDVELEQVKPAARAAVPVPSPSSGGHASPMPEPRTTLPMQAVRDPLAPREPLPPVRELSPAPPAPRDALSARAAAVGARTSSEQAAVAPPAPLAARAERKPMPAASPPPPVVVQGLGSPPPRITARTVPPVVEPAREPAPPEPREPVRPTARTESAKEIRSRSTVRTAAVVPPPPEGTPRSLELLREIHDRIAAQLDVGRVPHDRIGDETLWQRAETAVCDLVEQLEADGAVPASIDQDALIKDALNEILGLGPLEDLMADDEVTAVMVNQPDRVLVDRGGQLSSSPRLFSSEAAVRKVLDRLLASTGSKLDAATPLVDVRLRDGARLTAAVPPLAVRGPCLTLRKPRKPGPTMEELVAAGCLSPNMAKLMGVCVSARRNIVVCGGAAAGKTAFVTALAGLAGATERVISVEEVAELTLANDHWIALEARPPEADGKGGVALVDVVRAALRLRPDRLIIGDVRGAETLEVVSAMASSYEGTIVSVSGEGAAPALQRLEALARLAAPDAAHSGLHDLVGQAVQIVVHLARFSDGTRRVISIAEVRGSDPRGADGAFAVREIFRYRDSRFQGLGAAPQFYELLSSRGMAADAGIFK